MDFEQNVRLNFDLLSDNEKDMVFFIRTHKAQVVHMSIVELGEQLLSSKSSVLRLAKKLGFRGYSEMKYSLEQSIVQSVIPPTDLIALLKDEINRTFQLADQTNFQPILEQLKAAKTVVVYATGFTQNNFSKDFVNDLILSGRPAMLISGETNFEMLSHTLTKDDFVIVTSLSGETPSIKSTIKNLNMNRIPLCGVTELGKNFLSEHSDFLLYYETRELPSNLIEGSRSMIGLNILLSILSRKYREFILFDESVKYFV
ncbi:MurR/RpiR family transcriptional regulator [Enterococcus faecium]